MEKDNKVIRQDYMEENIIQHNWNDVHKEVISTYGIENVTKDYIRRKNAIK